MYESKTEKGKWYLIKYHVMRTCGEMKIQLQRHNRIEIIFCSVKYFYCRMKQGVASKPYKLMLHRFVFLFLLSFLFLIVVSLWAFQVFVM